MIKKIYLATMLIFIEKSLIALSILSSTVKNEVNKLKDQTVIRLQVYHFPLMTSLIVNNGRLHAYRGKENGVQIIFKHVNLAFKVFSFQESTPVAFAKNWMIVDGELSVSITFVRMLNFMESLLLPKFIAKKAVKEVCAIPLSKKLVLAPLTILLTSLVLFKPGLK